MSSAGDSAKFYITDAKLHVPIVTLLTKGSVFWNNYQTKLVKVIEKGKNLYKLLNLSFQGVRRSLAAGAVNNEAGIEDNRKYFLSRGEINNYSVLIDGRNFYDQPINDKIKQDDEVRKVQGMVMITLQVLC